VSEHHMPCRAALRRAARIIIIYESAELAAMCITDMPIEPCFTHLHNDSHVSMSAGVYH
jgi:hypothetical protein